MTDRYEFDTQDILRIFTTHVQGGTVEDFYHWFDARQGKTYNRGFSEGMDQAASTSASEITAAEQRGAVEAFREFAHELDATAEKFEKTALNLTGDDNTRYHAYAQGYRSASSKVVRRADQIEGNE